MVRRSVAGLTTCVSAPIQVVSIIRLKPAKPFVQTGINVVDAGTASLEAASSAVFEPSRKLTWQRAG